MDRYIVFYQHPPGAGCVFGYHWHSYPEKGWIGPYDTLEEAEQHKGYLISMEHPHWVEIAQIKGEK